MKYVKMLGLAAIAAAALTALVGVGTASATALYSGATMQPAGTQIESNLKTGTKAVLKAGFATIECEASEVDGKTSNTGAAGEEVSGSINGLSFTKCNATVTVLKKGSLFVAFTSGSDGTVSSEGAEVTVSIAGTSCTYGTPTKKTLGTLTGGSPANLKAEASLSRVAGGFLCANPAAWTAEYTVSTPNPLTVANS
jgi:hypothetical protein